MAGRRPQRRAAVAAAAAVRESAEGGASGSSSSVVPSASFYLGYVEDYESTEMIMRKFEELEKFEAQRRLQQEHSNKGGSPVSATAAAATAASKHKQQDAGVKPGKLEADEDDDEVSDEDGDVVMGGDARGGGGGGGGVSYTAEELEEMFRRTSYFSVQTALNNNELLAYEDESFVQEFKMHDREYFSDDEFYCSSSDDFWGATAAARRRHKKKKIAARKARKRQLVREHRQKQRELKRANRMLSKTLKQAERSRAQRKRKARREARRAEKKKSTKRARKARRGHRHSSHGPRGVLLNKFVPQRLRKKYVDPSRPVYYRIPAEPRPLSWSRRFEPFDPTAMPLRAWMAGDEASSKVPEEAKFVEHESLPRARFAQGDISKMNLEELVPNGGVQAVYMNPPWYSIEPGTFKHSVQITKALIPNGLLFIWTEKSRVAEVCDACRGWGFKYVENLVWVRQTPNNRFHLLKGKYIAQSKLTLLMFRRVLDKGDKSRLELRHQRTPDVHFDYVKMDPVSGEEFRPEAVYRSIEILLPEACYTEADAAADAAGAGAASPAPHGRLLELWAFGKHMCRKGWITVQDVKGEEAQA